jgi:hypothetical protein
LHFRTPDDVNSEDHWLFVLQFLSDSVSSSHYLSLTTVHSIMVCSLLNKKISNNQFFRYLWYY